jgi:uncharacterized protein YajQ (UPF0234 family)
MPSFDVVSKLDSHEIENAVNQAHKELNTRYDFQGTKSQVTLSPDRQTIHLQSNSKERLEAAYEVLLAKLSKRGVPLMAVQAGKHEQAGLGIMKQDITFQQGIPVEKSKELVALVKEHKLKVQASIQGDQLRVTGKSRDELQGAIALFKANADKVKVDMQFTNFRD